MQDPTEAMIRFIQSRKGLHSRVVIALGRAKARRSSLPAKAHIQPEIEEEYGQLLDRGLVGELILESFDDLDWEWIADVFRPVPNPDLNLSRTRRRAPSKKSRS